MKPIRKAVLPVAGLGTRFLPATKAIPKEMLTVVDRPVIQYVVDEARELAHDRTRQGRGEQQRTLPLARPPAVARERREHEGRRRALLPPRAEHVRVPDRGIATAVVGLSCELEDPARHRHGNPRVGELRYERVCL